jgi:hypothetical protein
MDGSESQKIAPAFSAYNPSLDIKNRQKAVFYVPKGSQDLC